MMKSSKWYLICLSIFLFLGCKSSSSSHFFKSSHEYDYAGGKTIELFREDEYVYHTGIFTGITWSTSHYFTYSFIIYPRKVKWAGKRNEIPEMLLFCHEDIIYHAYLRDELIPKKDEIKKNHSCSNEHCDRVITQSEWAYTSTKRPWCASCGRLENQYANEGMYRPACVF